MDRYTQTQQKIAKHYGAGEQSRQTIEEMAELTQALTKFWRYKGVEQATYNELKSDIIEEIADVQNMIEQLAFLFNAGDTVETIKRQKIDRQAKRVRHEMVQTK